MMNFKFTPRTTMQFVVGLVVATGFSLWLDSGYAGLAVMVGVVSYIANDKPKPLK